MKCKRECGFRPITITLETEEEVELMNCILDFASKPHLQTEWRERYPEFNFDQRVNMWTTYQAIYIKGDDDDC